MVVVVWSFSVTSVTYHIMGCEDNRYDRRSFNRELEFSLSFVTIGQNNYRPTKEY